MIKLSVIIISYAEKQSWIGLYYDFTKTKSSRVMRWDFVDFQVVLVPSQVVNANPSDSQVYPPLSVLDWKLSNLLSLQYKKNKGKFAAFNGRLKAKSFSASGGFAPWPPEQGLCPWTPLGGRGLPQTPVIGSRSRARHKRPRLFDPPLCVTFRCPWLLIRVSATVTVYRGHRRTLLFHDRDLPVHRVHMNYYK